MHDMHDLDDAATRARNQHLFFSLIFSLWRERQDQDFVWCAELIQQLMSWTCTDEERKKLTELGEKEGRLISGAYVGYLERMLDCFAMSGPDEAMWEQLLDCDYTLMNQRRPCGYWRYRVEREGRIGYVPEGTLTLLERETIFAELRREGDQLKREGEALLEEMRGRFPNGKPPKAPDE
jgi:hypothetical protein